MKNYRILILLVLVSMILCSCKVGRFMVYNFADIKDYEKFPSREINAGEEKFEFSKSEKDRLPREVTIDGEKRELESYLEENKTVAFLVIQNDTIQYEKYFANYDESSIVPSFSMAKSITSILIGCAIADGLINSVDEPITDYIPELSENGFDNVTIEHLLQMTSGLDFNESYFNPFGHAASFYYGRNLRKEINKLALTEKPGIQFEYVSGSTQVLGLVLERALEDRTISSYLEEKIWVPLNMEYNATWSIDRKKDGLEKTFCCLNARARDYAKIGRLYLNNGNWNGTQVVDEAWVKESTKVDKANGSAWYYQYQWWLPTTSGDFMAEGILGQFIYVNPDKNLIIVRLGKKEGEVDWWKLLPSLAKAY